MPGAVADLGAAAIGLATGAGEAVDDWRDAGTDRVMLESEPVASRAGSSDDSLQAIVKTIKRMTIVMLKRFTKNLLLLMNILFDDPKIMRMPLAGQSVQSLSVVKRDHVYYTLELLKGITLPIGLYCMSEQAGSSCNFDRLGVSP
jgi:hypothetical protein